MKFMQAVAHGRWIVSGGWLSESVKKGVMQPEEGFEISGTLKSHRDLAPQRARLDVAAHGGKGTLFTRHSVYFHGDFPSPGPQKSGLQELVTQAGGVVVRSYEELCNTPKKVKRVVVVSDKNGPADKAACGVAEGEDIACVDSYWIMNSITDYELEGFSKSLTRAAKNAQEAA